MIAQFFTWECLMVDDIGQNSVEGEMTLFSLTI